MWQSVKPGKRRCPLASMDFVAGPRNASISLELRTATTLSPRIAIASAQGCFELTVYTFAFVMITSAGSWVCAGAKEDRNSKTKPNTRFAANGSLKVLPRSLDIAKTLVEY